MDKIQVRVVIKYFHIKGSSQVPPVSYFRRVCSILFNGQNMSCRAPRQAKIGHDGRYGPERPSISKQPTHHIMRNFGHEKALLKMSAAISRIGAKTQKSVCCNPIDFLRKFITTEKLGFTITHRRPNKSKYNGQRKATVQVIAKKGCIGRKSNGIGILGCKRHYLLLINLKMKNNKWTILC